MGILPPFVFECGNSLPALSRQLAAVTVYQGISWTGLNAGWLLALSDAVQARGSAEGALVHFSNAGYQVLRHSWHIKGTGLDTIAAAGTDVFIVRDKAHFIMEEGTVGTDFNAASLGAVHAGAPVKEPSHFPPRVYFSELHLEPGLR